MQAKQIVPRSTRSPRLRRARFDRGKARRDLVELPGGPVAPAQRLGSHDVLVARQQCRVQHAVGQRLLDQHAPARGATSRYEIAIAQFVEVLENHPTVIEHRPVVGDERWYLAQRVVFNDRAVAIDRVRIRGQPFDTFVQAEFVGADQAFADIRRSSGVEDLQQVLQWWRLMALITTSSDGIKIPERRNSMMPDQ